MDVLSQLAPAFNLIFLKLVLQETYINPESVGTAAQRFSAKQANGQLYISLWNFREIDLCMLASLLDAEAVCRQVVWEQESNAVG